MARLKTDKATRTDKTADYFFDVDEDGTIIEPDFKGPKINSEIFDVVVKDLDTPTNIISEIEQADARWNTLVWRFRSLTDDEHSSLIRRIERQDYCDDDERRRMKRLAKELEDEDDGWKKWIKIEGEEGVSRFKKLIVDWLAAPIEWQEDMPDSATAVGSAKRFFERQELAILNKLDVWILEGLSPGNNYRAAMLGENLDEFVNPELALQEKIEQANEAAQKLGLWYRFRKTRKSK
jgi:hypothetical protein